MAITARLGELAAAERVLAQMATLIWPPKVAYAVRKLGVLVQAETRHWHEQRDAWIRELGDRKPDGSFLIPRTIPANGRGEVPNPKMAEFLKRMQELADVEVEIPWRPLTFEELERADDPETKAPAKFAPLDLVGLGPLLADPGDPSREFGAST